MHSKIIVMSFGLGGNHFSGIDANGHEFTGSWYLKPEQLQAFISNGHYSAAEIEGCVLLDKVAALQRNGDLAIDAPMLGVLLSDGKQDRMRDLLENPAASIVVGGVAQFSAGVALMTARAITDTGFVGLDRVCPRDYVAWWVAHGAIAGQVKDGCVEWSVANQSAIAA